MPTFLYYGKTTVQTFNRELRKRAASDRAGGVTEGCRIAFIVSQIFEIVYANVVKIVHFVVRKNNFCDSIFFCLSPIFRKTFDILASGYLTVLLSKKLNLYCTRGITPKLVASGGVHLRGLAPGLHSS